MKKLLLTLFIAPLLCTAQPGALDLSFNPGIGADSTIIYTAVQPNGKVLIGGAFSTFNGQPSPFLARLNDDGSLDNTFNIGTGPNLKVFSITIQPDGKILVGGSISYFNGDSVYKLVRLMPDGTTDTTFKADTIFSLMKEIIVQPDGKILIGGSFISVNGLPYINLARFHSNGKLDTSFNTLNALNGTVEAMALQPDGKVLIGGSFTQYAGVQGYRIARVNTDGSADTTFNPGIGGAGSNVEAICLLPNGKIILGGEFTFYNGSTVGHVVRTNTDGTIDFTYPQNPGTNLPVRAIASLPDGSHLFGGEFTSYQGNAVSTIVSVNNNGTFNSTFNPGTGVNGEITSLILDHKNRILVSGYFTSYNGTPRKRIARLYNCLTEKPDSIYGNPNALCSGTAQTYTLTPVSGATKYEWTLPNGWTGSSDSTSITAISNGSGGTIAVKAFTDSCGWSYVAERTINTIAPPGVDICLVTVDTASTHNIIIWEKPQTTLIDSFCIYRETTSNQYTKIASVAYAELSEYHDTSANPNTTSYRYKLSVLDTCGAESELSPYHNTIHLQNLGTGNFQWTFYQIENQLNPVISFNLYRDALNNGNYFPIGNIPGTNATFTDLTYASFPDANYVVDVNWNKSCTPSRQVSTTRSNIRKGGGGIIQIGISDQTPESSLRIYPNPANTFFTVSVPEILIGQQLTVTDLTGKLMAAVQLQTINSKLETAAWSAGIYYVKLGAAVKRLVVE